jgi:hypothetical protein
LLGAITEGMTLLRAVDRVAGDALSVGIVQNFDGPAIEDSDSQVGWARSSSPLRSWSYPELSVPSHSPSVSSGDGEFRLDKLSMCQFKAFRDELDRLNFLCGRCLGRIGHLKQNPNEVGPFLVRGPVKEIPGEANNIQPFDRLRTSDLGC